MKLLPVLLLNLATLGVGIVVYDQLRRDAASPVAEVEGVRSDSAALEPRIEALEADRRPVLGGGGIDPRLLARLEALEALVEAQVTTADPERAAPEELPTEADPLAPKATPDGPSPDEMRRWRKVRDAVRREDSIKKNHARFDRALDKLPFGLTPRQRQKIYAAHAAFEPRIGEIWGGIKAQAQETIAAGGAIDGQALRAQGAAQIQQEFADTITGIVHQTDAEAVAGAMLGRGK